LCDAEKTMLFSIAKPMPLSMVIWRINRPPESWPASAGQSIYGLHWTRKIWQN
jgi:hypothetical protein